MNIGIPFQIRALRESRQWTQKELAEKAGMLQPRVSAMETPGGSNLYLETLARIADAFDIGLVVKFVPFSELVDFEQNFDPDHFSVPGFKDDLRSTDPQHEAPND